MTRQPPPSVLSAFGVEGALASVGGGSSPIFLVDGIVLKEADDPEEVEWKSELLGRLPEVGFRLARPVATTYGTWIYEGWMASRFVVGHHDPTRLDDLLTSSRAFHSSLSGIPRPGVVDRLTHRWARAHRVVWEASSVEPIGPVGRCLTELQHMVRPVSAPSQLIHADLAGNVLHHVGMAPAILDFSPWWGPVGYADGILMADLLLWFGADIDSVSTIFQQPDFVQFLLRGAIFRLVALNEGAREGHRDFLGDVPRFERLASVIRPLLSHS